MRLVERLRLDRGLKAMPARSDLPSWSSGRGSSPCSPWGSRSATAPSRLPPHSEPQVPSRGASFQPGSLLSAGEPPFHRGAPAQGKPPGPMGDSAPEGRSDAHQDEQHPQAMDRLGVLPGWAAGGGPRGLWGQDLSRSALERALERDVRVPGVHRGVEHEDHIEVVDVRPGVDRGLLLGLGFDEGLE